VSIWPATRFVSEPAPWGVPAINGNNCSLMRREVFEIETGRSGLPEPAPRGARRSGWSGADDFRGPCQRYSGDFAGNAFLLTTDHGIGWQQHTGSRSATQF